MVSYKSSGFLINCTSKWRGLPPQRPQHQWFVAHCWSLVDFEFCEYLCYVINKMFPPLFQFNLIFHVSLYQKLTCRAFTVNYYTIYKNNWYQFTTLWTFRMIFVDDVDFFFSRSYFHSVWFRAFVAISSIRGSD